MTHLGERLTALVDGQLSAGETERAMAHLAGCRECREAVDEERLTKARLMTLNGPAPADDLVGRLLAMGGPSGPLPPRPQHVPGTPRPKPVPLNRPAPSRPVAVPSRPVAARTLRVRPAAGRPPAGPAATGSVRRSGVRRRRARLAGAVLGALGVVGAGVGGLVLAAPGIASGGAGAGLDTLTVQQRTASTSAPATERRPRFVPALGPSLPVAFFRPGR